MVHFRQKIEINKIFACPKCKTALTAKKNGQCPKCGFKYSFQNGIWNLLYLTNKKNKLRMKLLERLIQWKENPDTDNVKYSDILEQEELKRFEDDLN